MSVRTSLNRRTLLGAAALLALAGVAIALVSQHVFDMQPCAWCTFQRLLFLMFAVFALAGWGAAKARPPADVGSGAVGGSGADAGPGAEAGAAPRAGRGFAALALLTALAGIAAALWQHFVASASQSCAMTLADRIIKGGRFDEFAPWLFKATAFCDEANVPLAGIPYALWSAALFALLAGLSVAALRRGR